MFRKAILAGMVAAAWGTGIAHAQDATSAHSLSGNLSIGSQYIFRGLRQTDGDPTLQGGFDYGHASGLYLGTWASNVSWLRDFGSYTGGGSLEWDFYGGFRGSFGNSGVGYDVGLLYYYYPGTTAPGAVKANTLEAYGALSWKWLTAKYSYSLGDETFGVANSDGTWYFDLAASVPLTEKLALQAHYGVQEFDGANAGVSNDSVASYKDWKLGLTYALPQNFTIGAAYTDTDMSAAQKAFYTTPAGRFVGDNAFTVFISKTF